MLSDFVYPLANAAVFGAEAAALYSAQRFIVDTSWEYEGIRHPILNTFYPNTILFGSLALKVLQFVLSVGLAVWTHSLVYGTSPSYPQVALLSGLTLLALVAAHHVSKFVQERFFQEEEDTSPDFSFLSE